MKYFNKHNILLSYLSLPSRGAWIEICRSKMYRCAGVVAPFTGSVD
ncbi:hypothetical protein CLONEX_02499 [[Clostridium] nexile DSM 1787]|nr:hypothetical protein CLONEX_02499 [[Clostridium] nexile DSM 1787]